MIGAAATRARTPWRGSRVLLLDEGWLQTAEVATALEAAGLAVTVLTADGSTASYRRRTVQWCSGPALASPQFLPCLAQRMRDAAFDHVVPLTEAALSRLWDAGPAWRDHIYPEVDEWQCRLLRHKHLLVEYMASRGVAVPDQRRIGAALDISALDTFALDTFALDTSALVRELGMPLVVKAATGA